MRRVAALLWATATLSQDVCYPDYECQWSTYVAGTLYNFDFSHLCSAFGETIGAPPFTYRFNLCGRAPQYCLPLNGRQTFSRGTMIQFTDPATPPLACTDPTDGSPTYCDCLDPFDSTNRTCTADCEVLGVGLPEWSLQDPANPASGGVSLTYTGLSEGLSPCPLNPATGRAYLRTITYALSCDAGVPFDGLEVDSISEGAPCQYTLAARSGAACGCAPDCAGKTCGPDGCGGFCSGPTLYGVCPNGEACQGGVCCRRDCGAEGLSSKRDCGSDGCGGSCGTCGAGLYCATSHVCMDAADHLPRSGPVEWVQSGGALFGAWAGGALCFWVAAAAVAAHTTWGATLLRRAREVGVMQALRGGGAYESIGAAAKRQGGGGGRGLLSASGGGGGGGYGATAFAAPAAVSSAL